MVTITKIILIRGAGDAADEGPEGIFIKLITRRTNTSCQITKETVNMRSIGMIMENKARSCCTLS